VIRSNSLIQELMKSAVSRPMGGIDMGDHPPITPVAMFPQRARSVVEMTGVFMSALLATSWGQYLRTVLTCAAKQFSQLLERNLLPQVIQPSSCTSLMAPWLLIPMLLLPTHMALVAVIEMTGAFMRTLRSSFWGQYLLTVQQGSVCSCCRGVHCYGLPKFVLPEIMHA
jgi:hypothetical protein